MMSVVLLSFILLRLFCCVSFYWGHDAECHSYVWHFTKVIRWVSFYLTSVILLNVNLMSVILLTVIPLNVILLSFVLLCVILLHVILMCSTSLCWVSFCGDVFVWKPLYRNAIFEDYSANYHSAELLFFWCAQCHFDESHFTQLYSVESHSGDCHSAECHSAVSFLSL
jgi:hypothetical protein